MIVASSGEQSLFVPVEMLTVHSRRRFLLNALLLCGTILVVITVAIFRSFNFVESLRLKSNTLSNFDVGR